MMETYIIKIIHSLCVLLVQNIIHDSISSIFQGTFIVLYYIIVKIKHIIKFKYKYYDLFQYKQYDGHNSKWVKYISVWKMYIILDEI